MNILQPLLWQTVSYSDNAVAMAPNMLCVYKELIQCDVFIVDGCLVGGSDVGESFAVCADVNSR